ncbi:Uncharacterised protein [Corynebacterium amycolatum]|nr:Uncharacterised protein [Corynebacterium amycolatum]
MAGHWLRGFVVKRGGTKCFGGELQQIVRHRWDANAACVRDVAVRIRGPHAPQMQHEDLHLTTFELRASHGQGSAGNVAGDVAELRDDARLPLQWKPPRKMNNSRRDAGIVARELVEEHRSSLPLSPR